MEGRARESSEGSEWWGKTGKQVKRESGRRTLRNLLAGNAGRVLVASSPPAHGAGRTDSAKA